MIKFELGWPWLLGNREDLSSSLKQRNVGMLLANTILGQSLGILQGLRVELQSLIIANPQKAKLDFLDVYETP